MVLDYGSQYTQLIGRRIREMNVLSIMLPGDVGMDRILECHPKVIILSGGPNSIHVEGSPRVPPGFFEWAEENKIPVLGICYGMQMLVHLLGGRVKEADGRGEYGKMSIDPVAPSTLYGDDAGKPQTVWMSHGDEADSLPSGFVCSAKSKQGAVVAIEDTTRNFYGLQYHPEVMHSERGAATLRRFLFDICGLRGDWSMENVLEEQIAIVRRQVRGVSSPMVVRWGMGLARSI